MNRYTLITVGSLKTSWVTEGCHQYLDRMDINIIEISASKQKDPAKQMQEESSAILSKLKDMHGRIWVCDERGDRFTSEEFATSLEKLSDKGESVIFVLGGAYGLTDAVRERANTLIRFSDMVLPHELCRIVVLEQIYRSKQITKGTGYHH